MKLFAVPCFAHRQTRAAITTIEDPRADLTQLAAAEQQLDRFEHKHRVSYRSCALEAKVMQARNELVWARARLSLRHERHVCFLTPPQRQIIPMRAAPVQRRIVAKDAIMPSAQQPVCSLHRTGEQKQTGGKSIYLQQEGAWSTTQLKPAPRARRPRSPSLELPRPPVRQGSLDHLFGARPPVPPRSPLRQLHMLDSEDGHNSAHGSVGNDSLNSWATFGWHGGRRPSSSLQLLQAV